MTDLYDAVNAAWPADVPALTVVDASRMATRLWKAFAAKEGVRLRTFGAARRRWGSTEATRNSLNAGWRRMVHDVSHMMRARANPLANGHGPIHADLELRMSQYVISKGWLKPKLAKPKPDARQVRHARVLAAIDRWQRKQRRAETALRKLARQRRYYESEARA